MKFKKNVSHSDVDTNLKEFRTEYSGNLVDLKRNLENLGASDGPGIFRWNLDENLDEI
jgi:hypothetical protein